MAKYEVILFQPYLRQFVLNFGKHLKHFEFRNIANLPSNRTRYSALPSFNKEIHRNKLTVRNRLRRFIGIPNVRIRFDSRGDILFTYGALVVTRKPYFTYLETGLTLYNYDLGIAKNPIARAIVVFLATRANCKGLIFLSEAAKKSFFTTIDYPENVRRVLEKKCFVIYPVPIAQKSDVSPKKFQGNLKLLFSGTFYMKGGLELTHAYQKLRKTHSKLNLTVITPFQVLHPRDLKYLKSLPGLRLMDAKLNEQEMIKIYRSHDVFVLPTFRDGFGLVLIEALAYGMPIIITDQYATAEMVIDSYNGFIYPNHPLKDYDPKTFKLLGRYYNPKDFYADLFALQKQGKLKPVENFLITSIKRFLDDPTLLRQFSKNSLALYKKKFDADKLSNQIETVFLDAVQD